MNIQDMTDQAKSGVAYILNEKNKPITAEYIESTLAVFGIKIKVGDIGNDQYGKKQKQKPMQGQRQGQGQGQLKSHLNNKFNYFQQAMIHLSYLVRDKNFYGNNKTKPYQIQSDDIEPLDPAKFDTVMPLQTVSYERLEFLGDAKIHAILAEYLFTRYPDQDEGFMTKLRTKIENGNTLSKIARTIHLEEYVVVSRYIEINGGRQANDNIMEDAFEAFIGALYLNFGYDVCNRFVTGLIEKEIDISEMLFTETNFKEKLLQYFHLMKWSDPIYGTLDVSGPENKKKYTVYVKCKKSIQDAGDIIGIGVGQSKKKGEQIAAMEALTKLGVYKENDDSDEEIALIG